MSDEGRKIRTFWSYVGCMTIGLGAGVLLESRILSKPLPIVQAAPPKVSGPPAHWLQMDEHGSVCIHSRRDDKELIAWCTPAIEDAIKFERELAALEK